MKTEFEFTIPRTNSEDPCLATVSVAADPNGNPSFEILVINRAGNYVETREDEEGEIIDKAIERWGVSYARVFGDRHCDETIRARVDFVERELQPDARESDGFPPPHDLKPEFRLRLAQQFEEWRATDKLSAYLRASQSPHCVPAAAPLLPPASSGDASDQSSAAYPASPPPAPVPPAPPDFEPWYHG